MSKRKHWSRAHSGAVTRLSVWGLGEDRIIISCKVSRLGQMVSAYRELANETDTPLHLGLTEAGMGTKGVVATTAALSILLEEGIGDTIRSSLTPEPGGDRAREVRLCQEILQALGLRSFRPAVTACPGCGRTTSTLFRELAQDIQAHLDTKMAVWKDDYPGVAELKVAVMGCVVNGPGSPGRPTSAYRCPAREKPHGRRSSSMGRGRASSRATPSPAISSRWSRITC